MAILFILPVFAGLLKIVIIFAGLFFLLWYYLKNSRKEPVNLQPAAENPQDKASVRIVLPLRLQACERFVLFLERIYPANLLLRLNEPGLTAVQLQSMAVRTIREEFGYNLSQQIYISQQTWDMIRSATEETISLINQAAGTLHENALATDLIHKVLAFAANKQYLPVDKAIAAVRKEVSRLV